jgi:2-polyprenyl-6-methoxyphenol hydroxylase-like FAD-dependent oxidoreductase
MSGERWLAVGDAASTFQPLASAGVAKALWDGFRAPEALRDRREYEKDQRALFHTYMRQIQQHYALETRWPESDFWTSMATALRRPGSSEALATD